MFSTQNLLIILETLKFTFKRFDIRHWKRWWVWWKAMTAIVAISNSRQRVNFIGTKMQCKTSIYNLHNSTTCRNLFITTHLNKIISKRSSLSAPKFTQIWHRHSPQTQQVFKVIWLKAALPLLTAHHGGEWIRPQIKQYSLGPTMWVSHPNRISISSNIFAPTSVCSTHRHTHHVTCDIRSNKLHLCTACMLCSLIARQLVSIRNALPNNKSMWSQLFI